MAEIMNEFSSSSNGEVDEKTDEMKLNGDVTDISTATKSPSQQKDDQLHDSISSSNKKPDDNDVDCEQTTVKSSSTMGALANGRLKSDAASSETDKDESSPSDTVTNDCNSSTKEHVIDDDSGDDSNCDKAESGNQSDSKTDTSPSQDSTASITNSQSTTIDEIVATDLTKRSKESDDKNANGGDEDDEANEDDEVVSISSTPDKGKKTYKKSSLSIINVTPRRSSRNLNKQKSYSEKDVDFETSDAVSVTTSAKKRASCDDDEIQEVTPIDPLADEPRSAGRMRGNKTIVVSDTKGLVEFASNTKASRSNKKEPTLVIIDTNSILSGRGPVPVSQQSSSSSMLHSSSAPIPVSLPIQAGAFSNSRNSAPSSSAFSVIPIGLPAQGVYPQFKNPPPQIKPIVIGPASTSVTAVPMAQSATTNMTTVTSTQATNKQPPVVLPSLTDDMFVVEAPSFIVPYVYEKPPMKSLKEHIEKIENDIKLADESKDNSSDKKTQNDEKSAPSDDVSKEKATESGKEESSKDDSKQPDQDGKIPDKDQPPEDKPNAEKKPEEGNSTERMEVDDPDSKPASTAVDSDSSVKKMEIDSSPVNAVKEIEKKITAGPTTGTDDPKKPASYFDNPLGKFFMQIGLNLVQEHVQTDLLRSQRRKRDKEGGQCSEDMQSAIEELTKTLESSKENNDPFKLELKKCELCSFKTESSLVMAHHLETPHMKNYSYRCNFCSSEVRSPHDILFHMEAEHNIRGRLERAPAFHQCPNCPFEDNQKGKLTRHLISCAKKYRPERNQEPPLDWEPPAKIPRVTRNRPPSMSPGSAVYQAAMSGLKQAPQNTLLPKLLPNTTNMKHNMLNAANKRPNFANTFVNRFPNAPNAQPNFSQRPIMQNPNQGMMFRAGGTNSQTPVLLPQGYHLSGAQIYQAQNNKSQSAQQSMAAAKLLNQPSISITPLPRQTSSNNSSSNMKSGGSKSSNSVAAASKGGGNFVVCEICDGYIKDLEQLRNHMQCIHKVKIHPKMIYNRPPLNCQKCQERFFTDQGLERHLLGAHGLVTSSMQEAANKGKDGGRCPVCGRVYQWKLLNHVARDHQMALKPAHLSYKCTVCTATFGMYKQFENHVYSAHSVVAKRAMDAPKKPSPAPSSSQNDALLKPLKINDEITIIPQPIRSTRPSNRESNAATITKAVSISKKMDCEPHDNDNSNNDADNHPADDQCKCSCLMENFANYEGFRKHVTEKHLKSFKITLSRLDLKSLNRVPNKENVFKLTALDSKISDEIRDKYQLNDFFIQIKRHRLCCDYSYKIVENQSSVECVENPEALYVVPETVYSDTEDTDEKKIHDTLLANTLFVQRKVDQNLTRGYGSTPYRRIAPAATQRKVDQNLTRGYGSTPYRRIAPAVTPPIPSSTLRSITATFNGGDPIRRSRRNRARRSSRMGMNSLTSDDLENLGVRRKPLKLNTSTSNRFVSHFMTELASFSNPSAIRRDPSYYFGSESSAVMSKSTVTVSHQTTSIGEKNQRSKIQHVTKTIFNQQTVTMSTSTSAPKPTGLARNSLVMNASNATSQRSVKVDQNVNRLNSFRSMAEVQPQLFPQPAACPAPPRNISKKPEEIISLLSDSDPDSDSDQFEIEIVDCDPAACNDNEEYILPI